MLLSHTAGFGYTPFNNRLRRWAQPVRYNEFSKLSRDILGQPIFFKPGTQW